MNAFMLPDPQKTVISSPFRPPMKPLTTMTNRTAGATLRHLVDYLATDDIRHVPLVMASALRA